MACSGRPVLRVLLVLLAPACGTAPTDDATGGASSSGGGTTSDGGPDPGLCAPTTVPVLAGPGARQLERVATREAIPGLADQPTVHGQALGTLFAFDGRLHLGYGDYDANTGPIAMSAWDPLAAAFIDLGTLPAEEVLWFRQGEGTLYSPAIDPDGHQESGGVYRLDCGAAAWHVGAPIPGAVHVHDVAVQGAAIYAGTGSLTGEPALLMASQDHGQSWTELLRRDSAPDRFSRFYYVGATPEQLFVSGRDYPSPGTSFAWLRQGQGDFQALNDPPGGFLVPIVLGDAMVVTAFAGTPGRSDDLATYRVDAGAFVVDSLWPALPGGEATLVAWGPDSDPGRLLVLMRGADGSASVQRTDDLSVGAGAWDELAALAPLPTDEYMSMALLRNDLYLGTRLGALYALRELDRPRP